VVAENFFLINRAQLFESLGGALLCFDGRVIQNMAVRQVRVVEGDFKGPFSRHSEISHLHALFLERFHDRH
jgi:hypothetical protein